MLSCLRREGAFNLKLRHLLHILMFKCFKPSWRITRGINDLVTQHNPAVFIRKVKVTTFKYNIVKHKN